MTGICTDGGGDGNGVMFANWHVTVWPAAVQPAGSGPAVTPAGSGSTIVTPVVVGGAEVVDRDRVRQRLAGDHRVGAVLLADDEVGDVTRRGGAGRGVDEDRPEQRGAEQERGQAGPQRPAGMIAATRPARHSVGSLRAGVTTCTRGVGRG